MPRSAKSTVRFVYGDLRFHSQIANPLSESGTFDLAQHKGRYVAVLLWCLPHAKLLLSCCAFEFLTFYGAATRYSASSSIGNSSGDFGRWPVASVRSPRSIDIGLSSNSKFRAVFSQLPVHMASSIVHRVGVFGQVWLQRCIPATSSAPDTRRQAHCCPKHLPRAQYFKLHHAISPSIHPVTAGL